MSIHTLISSVSSSCTRYPSTFAAARERQPALAPFDGANALVDELRAGVANSPQRYAIVNALMLEQERAKHPLWQALLVVAFAPMLRKTRADCPWKDDRDTDQIVLLAFLEAIASVRVEHAGAYMAIALYWVMRHSVMATVRTESILRQLQRVGIEHGAPAVSRDPDPVAATGFAEIVRVVREEAGAELAEAFLATSIGGESMREFVARTYPTLDERARESLCRRLHRERDQLLPQLQERLAA